MQLSFLYDLFGPIKMCFVPEHPTYAVGSVIELSSPEKQLNEYSRVLLRGKQSARHQTHGTPHERGLETG
jgi:hypothetical protein